LYRLICRAHLSGTQFELLQRRIIVTALLTWAPLLLLSVVEGRAWGSSVQVPFLLDVEIQLRMLVALPLLIGGELLVHRRLRLVAGQFLERGLIAPGSATRYEAAIASAIRLRNSVPAELILVAVVYGLGAFYLSPHVMAANADVTSWYAEPAGNGYHLSGAGWWRAYVSLPIFQIILIRWYFRIFIWIRLLWRISRCELKLVPTHPDRVGGLGFLSLTPVALAPFLAAQGVVLASLIADQIFHHGAKLPDFRDEVIIIVAFIMLVVLAPLLMFVPKLAAAKRVGLREYGTLAQRYVREFDDKWLRGGAGPGEALVGSADIQSLADMGNSFEVVRSMRLVPITWAAVVRLVAITLLPVAPLLLTMIPAEEILKALLKMLL
jgi:hypothetical protein